jgi:Na+-transporting NADH:ubiquinone oxidoreductase subunit C
MKQFSNIYIVIFSTIMVIVVATILSFVSMQLKPRQIKNEEIEQMKNILASVNIISNAKNAEERFNKYIVDSYAINIKGEQIEDTDAFSVDMKKEVSKIQKINNLNNSLKEREKSPFSNFITSVIKFKRKNKAAIESEILNIEGTRKLPLYICKKGKNNYYVFALRGKGLWGPIWGYISLKDDFNTVYGIYFGHESETPGLGAEISESEFQAMFRGKKLFENSQFVSVKVIKGGAEPDNKHGVDAISGGTVTSRGVENMLFDCLSGYKTFINKQRINHE